VVGIRLKTIFASVAGGPRNLPNLISDPEISISLLLPRSRPNLWYTRLLIKSFVYLAAGQDMRLETGWNASAFILAVKGEELFGSDDGWKKQRENEEAIHDDSDPKDYMLMLILWIIKLSYNITTFYRLNIKIF
jgi:hypothetical protein